MSKRTRPEKRSVTEARTTALAHRFVGRGGNGNLPKTHCLACGLPMADSVHDEERVGDQERIKDSYVAVVLGNWRGPGILPGERRALTLTERSFIVNCLMMAGTHYDRLRSDVMEEKPFLNSPSISQRTVSEGFLSVSNRARELAALILNDEVRL